MSLKTLKKINEALERRPAELAKARAEGKKVVGWLNYAVPEEIIYAAGLIPIHLGTGGSDRLVELGSRYISVMNCVFTRQVMGLFEENKDPYIQNSDMVFIDVTCKQLFRVAELIKYYFSVNVDIIGVPYNFDVPAGRVYFQKEIKAFSEKLEAAAGRKITEADIENAVTLFDAIRGAIKKLYALQAQPHTPISWHEAYDVVQAGYYLDKAAYLALLQELLDEIEAAPPNPDNLANKPRIFVSGSIIPPGDRKLLDIIEEKGGRVVADDLWSGYAPYFDTKIESPTIDGIADAYLTRHLHASLPILNEEGDQRIKNIFSLVREFNVDGVLFHSLRYCDCFTFKANNTKEALKQQGISFLEIHTEYADSDYEAIRTRVEAFVEALAAHASSRKGVQ